MCTQFDSINFKQFANLSKQDVFSFHVICVNIPAQKHIEMHREEFVRKDRHNLVLLQCTKDGCDSLVETFKRTCPYSIVSMSTV